MSALIGDNTVGTIGEEDLAALDASNNPIVELDEHFFLAFGRSSSTKLSNVGNSCCHDEGELGAGNFAGVVIIIVSNGLHSAALANGEGSGVLCACIRWSSTIEGIVDGATFFGSYRYLLWFSICAASRSDGGSCH